MSVVWTEAVKEIAGIKLHVARAGSGPTVLVLHHDIGTLERLPFYDSLAEKFDVVIPHHPGWGKSERPQWMRHPRDIAAIYAWLLADLGVSAACHWSAWVSAAGSRRKWRARRPRHTKLVLVGAMGIKPPEGEIADQAIVSYIDYPRSGFHDQAAFAADYGDVYDGPVGGMGYRA